MICNFLKKGTFEEVIILISAVFSQDFEKNEDYY